MLTGNPKPHILVVDDEADLRDLLVEEIQSLSYQTTQATNGVDAFEKLSSGPKIDVVLTDINMPKMNGLDLLKKIRESKSNVPVIILTGYGDAEKTIVAKKLGAFEFLDKPYDRKLLLDAIKKAVESVQAKLPNLKAA
jgi:DNA-binding NtrC family response regulator